MGSPTHINLNLTLILTLTLTLLTLRPYCVKTPVRTSDYLANSLKSTIILYGPGIGYQWTRHTVKSSHGELVTRWTRHPEKQWTRHTVNSSQWIRHENLRKASHHSEVVTRWTRHPEKQWTRHTVSSSQWIRHQKVKSSHSERVTAYLNTITILSRSNISQYELIYQLIFPPSTFSRLVGLHWLQTLYRYFVVNVNLVKESQIVCQQRRSKRSANARLFRVWDRLVAGERSVRQTLRAASHVIPTLWLTFVVTL